MKPASSDNLASSAGAGTHHRLKEHGMSTANIGIVLVAVALAATGQVLLRYGMRRAAFGRPVAGELILRAVTSPSVLGGLAVFGVSAIVWLWALSRVPLSIAYPFNGLGFIAIVIASGVFLDEHIRPFTWLGVVLVAVGVACVAIGG